jgi:hypothetical protein
MIFKPMKKEDVLKSLGGQEDVLTPEVKRNEEYFRSLSCPYCGNKCMPFVDPSRLFREGDLLPNYMARCVACGSEFEPYTKILTTVPHPNKVTF